MQPTDLVLIHRFFVQRLILPIYGFRTGELGFGPSVRDHLFSDPDATWARTFTCQQARIAQTGTPIADQKELTAAVGAMLSALTSVGLFS